MTILRMLLARVVPAALFFLMCALPVRAFYCAAPYVMEGGKLMVRAVVGGQTGRFILDTGAPCTLTDAFARRAAVSGMQQQRFSDSNGNVASVRIANLPGLVLGGVEFVDLQAAVLEPGSIMEQMGADGIIGYNLMRQGVVKFDARRRLFILTDVRDSLGLDYNYCSELLPNSFVPMLPVRVGTSVDTVMFDSGAESLYEMSVSSFSRLRVDTSSVGILSHGFGTLSAGAAGIETNSEKWRLLIPSFHVGNAAFSRATTITTDAPDSRIGAALLLYGDVVIDYADGFFYFMPHNPQTAPDVYEPEWNVVLTVQGDALVAGMIWDDAGSGIRSGDPIVAVRGKRVGKVDLRAALTQDLFSLDPTGTPVTFLDRRSGQERDVVLCRQ